MKLEASGVTIVAHFYHRPPYTKTDIKADGTHFSGSGFTTCTLHLGECTREPHETGFQNKCTTTAIGIGRAHCIPGDQFSYAIGRKIALTRAVKAAEIPKPERAALWASYFARCPYRQPTQTERTIAKVKKMIDAAAKCYDGEMAPLEFLRGYVESWEEGIRKGKKA